MSFIAGGFTVAAPCILPLLPVIVGGSLSGVTNSDKSARSWLHPVVITASLAISVIVFGLLLKATTLLLGVSSVFWQVVSGTIIIILGLTYLWPRLWGKLALKSGLAVGSSQLLASSSQRQGWGRDVLIGSSLGPVFNSCSPTYALIVAAILPVSFFTGLSYLVAYALGLALMLLIIAFAGQAFVRRLGWLSNPRGKLRLTAGVIFILVGLVILLGIDKKIQTYVLDSGWYAPIGNLEQRLR